MTEREHRSPPPAGILAVFQEELVRSPAGIERRDPSLRPRFVAHYLRLARLPRKARRALQRQWRRPLAGIALWCALGQIPAAPAAPIDVGVGGCTLVDAITAANRDAPTGGCPAGGGADMVILPAGSNQTLSSVDNDTYGPTGLPLITSAIVIDGNGSTIGRVPETPAFRILAIASRGELTLQETTVTAGVIPPDRLMKTAAASSTTAPWRSPPALSRIISPIAGAAVCTAPASRPWLTAPFQTTRRWSAAVSPTTVH
jgi:hypothetical protein